MSRLQTILDTSIPIRKGGVFFKKYQKLLTRTDHIVCHCLEGNSMRYVYCSYIPMYIGYVFGFNADIYSSQLSKKKATNYLKNLNFKKRLYGNSKESR